MSILGHDVQRVEDPRFLTGQATYVANVQREGLAHVEFVRSPLAHGRIVELDVDDARAMPGVLAVVTAADLDSNVTPAGMVPMPPTLARPLRAADGVRFVGEPIVAVVADTRGSSGHGATRWLTMRWVTTTSASSGSVDAGSDPMATLEPWSGWINTSSERAASSPTTGSRGS